MGCSCSYPKSKQENFSSPVKLLAVAKIVNSSQIWNIPVLNRFWIFLIPLLNVVLVLGMESACAAAAEKVEAQFSQAHQKLDQVEKRVDQTCKDANQGSAKQQLLYIIRAVFTSQ